MNIKNTSKLYKMNYIELFGIPGAGKSYTQKKIINNLKKNNLPVLQQKELIIKFYFKNFNKNPVNYIRFIFLFFFYTKFFTFIKSFFKREKTIINKNNKVYFLTPKKKSHHKIVDLLEIENSYEEILRILGKKIIRGKSAKFYRMILKEINSLNIDSKFNFKLKKWFLESLILVEIQKKENLYYCVTDEGIIHRVFSIFCLKKNKKSFIKKFIQYFEKYGELYLIKTDLKKIYKRTVKRERINHGFIYNDKKQIQNYYYNLNLFEKFIIKKIFYKTIKN